MSKYGLQYRYLFLNFFYMKNNNELDKELRQRETVQSVTECYSCVVVIIIIGLVIFALTRPSLII